MNAASYSDIEGDVNGSESVNSENLSYRAEWSNEKWNLRELESLQIKYQLNDARTNGNLCLVPSCDTRINLRVYL